MKKNYITLKSATFFFSIIMLVAFFSFRMWHEKKVIDWDITLYYSYLPATFIYQDYEFSDPEELWEERHFGLRTTAEGDSLPVKMTAGLAYLYSPFFLAAHIYASLMPEVAANAFSKPYRLAILLSTCIWSIVGFWALGKFLMLFFPQSIASITALVIFAGTNIPYYSLVEPMTHVYSLALICLLFLSFFKYLKKPSSRQAIILGLLAGLISLIRPSNILILLFLLVLFLASSGKPSVRTVIRHLLLAALAGIIIWLPQFIYWFHITGSPFFYSYGEEGFFFTEPAIWKGLFSYRKGWFVYSPVLFLVLPGLWLFFQSHKRVAIAAYITLAAAIYLVFSWWCWWYGGGFGARAMIEYLPLMALPMAAIIHQVNKAKLWLKITSAVLIAFLCFWSLFMNWQYFHGFIHYDSMTKELYWDQFMKDGYAKGFWQGLDQPDYESAKSQRE